MRVFLRVYPIVFVLLIIWEGQLWSQDLNPTYVETKILQGTTFEIDFISSAPIAIVGEENIGGGSTRTQEISLNIDYKFLYDSDPDFTGESSFIVELTSVKDRGLKVYSEIRIKVVPSLIEAVKDVVFIPSGQDEILIDALSNDIPGFGTSSIINVDLVKNGSATMIDNNISFTKAIGFTGETSFNYTIQDDDTGYKSSGIVTILAQGSEPMAGRTFEYVTSATSPVDILIDDTSYQIDPESILGLGSISDYGDFVRRYTPNITGNGFESFELVNEAGEYVTVIIEIINNNNPGLLVNDDIYYSSIGTSITFDPRDNDHSRDGVINKFSEELSFDGTNLTYVPDAGFSGVKNFYYTVVDGQKEITGNIEVYIGNYLPQLEVYSFETFEGSEFVFEYNAPIKDYSWSIVEDAYDGLVTVNVGSRSSFCAQSNGYHMVVYSPDQGFTGQDDFTLEYCVSNGDCKTVQIFMNVLPSNENCHCFGADCVWSGDADNDGKVSVEDVLSIGYNYGELGIPRENQSDEWSANFSEDWPFEQEESDINNKYADTNGDGIINSEDVDILNQNISLYHSINAQEVIAQKDVALIFEGPESSEAGELVTFDVYIGREDAPVVDLRGVTFSVRFPTDLVDPESIRFTPLEDWLGIGSPIISAVNIDNGLLEVGMSRTAAIGSSGNGKIGELSLVVTVDIDGYAPNGEDPFIDFLFEKAIFNNTSNKKFQIQADPVRLNLQLENKSFKDDLDIVVFPNPSHDQLSFKVAYQNLIKDIRVYNMMGGLVLDYQDIEDRSFEFNHNLAQGIYTAAITTDKGVSVEKIQVIRE